MTARREDTRPQGAERPASVPWALAGLSIAMLLPSLGISIANVALPTLAQAFDAAFQPVQWIVIAYLLATTTMVVGAGRLGDLIGRRRLLLGGIVLFTAASALCAAAPALWLLIAARAAQGVGAAAMMALTMAFVGQIVPKDRTGSAMGLLGTMSAVGTAFGPSLGGVLIAGFGWRAIFLVNLPLGVLAALLVLGTLPADRDTARAGLSGFDRIGTILLGGTLGAYALAMTVGRGGFGSLNVALLLAAAILLGLFVRVETKAPSPLVPIAMVRAPTLGAALLTNALVSTVMMATLVVGPFYLSRVFALDTLPVGGVMSIGPLTVALSGIPAGRIVDRFGAQRMTIGGLIGMAAGCALLTATPATLGVAGYIAPIVVVTVSYALFQAANNTGVMVDIVAERRGLVSGLLTLSRSLGLVTGASVMGAVFAFASGTVDMAAASPQAVAGGMRITFALAAALIVLAVGIAAGSRVLPTASRSTV